MVSERPSRSCTAFTLALPTGLNVLSRGLWSLEVQLARSPAHEAVSYTHLRAHET